MKTIICTLIALCALVALSNAQCNTFTYAAQTQSDFCDFTDAMQPAGGHEIDGTGLVAGIAEQAYGNAWPLWEAAINNAASYYGIGVCSGCLTGFKAMICAAIVPKCGFNNCVLSVVSNISACLTGCGCDPSNGQTCTQAHYQCMGNCVVDVFSNTCAQYMIGKAMCEQYVDVCTCGNLPQAWKDAACQYFHANGYNWNIPGDITTCTGSNGWCAPASAFNKRATPTPGQVPIAGGSFSLGAPQSQGTYGSANAEPFTISDDARNAASGLVIAPFVVMVALLFSALF